MPAPKRGELSRRERQVMDALYRLGRGSVTEVRERLPDPPGYDSVRTILRILEEKGFVEHEEEGRRYVYRPVAAGDAREEALVHLVRTFFDDSAGRAALALLRRSDVELGEEEIRELEARLGIAATSEDTDPSEGPVSEGRGEDTGE